MLNKEHDELKAKFKFIESQTKVPLKQFTSIFNFNPVGIGFLDKESLHIRTYRRALRATRVGGETVF